MKKAAFYTLGCKVNQYETEAMAGLFEKEGYRVVDFSDRADVYVINTCTVTNLSDRKSRQMIRRARSLNRDAVIVALGCYAQTAPDEVAGIEGVNLVLGTGERGRIFEYLKEIGQPSDKVNAVGNIMEARKFEELGISACKGRTRAFLKIQEGCSQFCAYCIIPYARGPIRSRLAEDVLKEVKSLAQSGFKEIVLTGIHLASYGKDLKNTSLTDIIRKVHEVDGIERIRLGSIEPSTVNRDFIGAVKGLEKICPHFHISLQSGCDETLKRMNRKYTTEDYIKAVGLIRENIRDVALTTDVMVGFPGETDEEFEETCSFLKRVSFARLHVFKYSPRKGTPAASFTGQIPPEKKDERSGRLLELARRLTLDFNAGYTGRVMPVLYEQEEKSRSGFMEGLTPNYIRVVSAGGETQKGLILDTRLESAAEDYVLGRIIHLA